MSDLGRDTTMTPSGQADSVAGETLMELSSFTPFIDGLDHPECVTWGPDGNLYAGGEAGQVYRATLDGGVEEIGTTGGFVLGLCLDGDRNVYACDSGNRAIMQMSPGGRSKVYFAGTHQRQLVNPNYPVFDRDGNLYFSDSGEFRKDNGCLWVVRPDGEGEILREDVAGFPNGVALDAAGDYLYVVVSTVPAIVRVPLGGGPVETVAEFERKVPDGIAFDENGDLYVACYAPDEILRITTTGRVETVAADWERVVLAAPTNIAFCGPSLRTLVVASLGRWHLTKAEMPVGGQPYHYPRLSGRRSQAS